MAEVLIVALSFALNAGLPYAIVKYDLKRLPPERLSRAWNEASFLSAVIVFGALSIPVHFVKTRRSLVGLGWASASAWGRFCAPLRPRPAWAGPSAWIERSPLE